jgi:hypothetical protein
VFVFGIVCVLTPYKVIYWKTDTGSRRLWYVGSSVGTGSGSAPRGMRPVKVMVAGAAGTQLVRGLLVVCHPGTGLVPNTTGAVPAADTHER